MSSLHLVIVPPCQRIARRRKIMALMPNNVSVHKPSSSTRQIVSVVFVVEIVVVGV